MLVPKNDYKSEIIHKMLCTPLEDVNTGPEALLVSVFIYLLLVFFILFCVQYVILLAGFLVF